MSTIADYLMPTLLESDLHVITRRSTNIIPEDGLLNAGCMLGPDTPTLRIDDVLFPHCLGEVRRALTNQR